MIFLACCNYGHKIEAHHAMQLVATANMWAKVELAQDYHTPRGRSILANHFLQHEDCTHMLFIDPDLLWTPEHAKRIISHDVPIVGGIYAEKCQERKWLGKRLDNAQADENGLVRAVGVATGFMLISRAALEQLKPHVATWQDNGETMWEFFRCGVSEGNYWTEDYLFCRDCERAGVEMYLDTACIIPHQGICAYPIRTPDEKAGKVPHGDRLDVPQVVNCKPRLTKRRGASPKADKPDPAEWATFPFPNITGVWRAYLGMRKEKKCKPLLNSSLEMLFGKMRAAGEAETKRALEASIANGWQGVFLKEAEVKMEGLKL
jgi:hypothetical protein